MCTNRSLSQFATALLYAVCLVAVAPSASSWAQTTAKVINGTPVVEDAPWMVSIGVPTTIDPGHMCGGTLIDSRTVLTAAHCVAEYESAPYELHVVQGSKLLSDRLSRSIEVTGIVLHPDYNPEYLRNDLALVTIAEDVILASYPQPMSRQEYDGVTPLTARLYGWGMTMAEYPVRPDHLLSGEIPVISDDECSTRLGLDFDRNSMLCGGKLATSQTAEDGVDACSGDSGGPLMDLSSGSPRILGVVSWGFACGSSKLWGVYSRVPAFSDWIASRPLVKPYPETGVTVRGLPMVGRTLTCIPGEWGGAPADTTTFSWIDPETGPIPGRNGRRFKVRRKDIGRALFCVVERTNAGGTGYASSDEVTTVLPRIPSLAGRKNPGRHKASSQSGRSATVCDKKGCNVVVDAQRPFRTARATLISKTRKQVLLRVTPLSESSVLVRYPSREQGEILVRIVYEDRTYSLLRVPLGRR